MRKSGQRKFTYIAETLKRIFQAHGLCCVAKGIQGNRTMLHLLASVLILSYGRSSLAPSALCMRGNVTSHFALLVSISMNVTHFQR